MRTNDIVTLSYALSLLQDAGIDVHVADRHMSVLEGSIGVFPRRVMVEEGAVEDARRVLVEGGLAAFLVTP